MNLLRLCALLLLAPPTSAQRAEDDFDHERYEAAAQGFAEAYAQTQDLVYLYAQAKSLQTAGDCESAVPLFQAFVAENQIRAADQEARKNLAECGATTTPTEASGEASVEASDAAPGAETGPGPAVADLAVESPPSTDGAGARPSSTRLWYRDPLGGVFAGVGVAGIAAGATLAGVARRSQGQADRAGDVGSFGRNNDRAVTLSRASIPVLVVGGAFVTAAVVRYALLARGRGTSLAQRFPGSFTVRF